MQIFRMIKSDYNISIPWAIYTALFGGVTYMGILPIMFFGFHIGRDTTDEEMTRCFMGVFIYLVVMFVIFIGGGFILHYILKKKNQQRNTSPT